MPNDRAAPKELKVTDKRIFTPEGEIREEFKQDIRPNAPEAAPQPAPPPQPKTEAQQPQAKKRADEPRQKPPGDPAAPPATQFASFVQSLVVQTYMFLGMLSNRYQPPMKPDPAAARETIEILVMLEEKTRGNLTPEEADFLATAVSELKLAYVQRTKNI